MKKLTLLSLIVLSATGCGHGWLPFRQSRGATCLGNAPCVGSLPPAPSSGCEGCPTAAGFPDYSGEVVEGVVGSGAGYYGGEVIHEGPITGGFQGRTAPAAPPMQSIRPN